MRVQRCRSPLVAERLDDAAARSAPLDPHLVLPVRGLRLQVLPEVGHDGGSCGFLPQIPKEPTVVTRDQIIYQRRRRVLAHAEATGNVAETCRIFGVSRTRFYEWRRVAER